MNSTMRLFLSCFLLSVLSLSAFAKGVLTVRLQPVFRGKPLIFHDKTYVSSYGESMTFDEFKFYISTLQLSGDKTTYIVKNSAYLINAEDTATL